MQTIGRIVFPMWRRFLSPGNRPKYVQQPAGRKLEKNRKFERNRKVEDLQNLLIQDKRNPINQVSKRFRPNLRLAMV